MATLWQSLRRREGRRSESFPWPTISLEQWASQFAFGGNTYSFFPQQTLTGNREEIGADFRGYIEGAYKSNGVVFACCITRQLVFSEARFQFRERQSGRPGNLFGSRDLQILERPWVNGTTGDLLSRMIQDVDLAGNFYGARRRNNRVKRLRPDWVTIIMGTNAQAAEVDPEDFNELDAEVLGYAYHPGGKGSGKDPEILLREEVAHFAPIPDPAASYRGMSWITPVIREVMGDSAATSHKLQFFENGATPNMVISLDPAVNDDASKRLQAAIADRFAGMHNAYETMVLGGGAKVEVVGKDMKQIDFKVTQGHGETRIAAAAGVPPVIVGLSEGLEAATYSNYGQAKRRMADGTMRPLWRGAAASLSTIVKVPEAAELWYDDRDIPFLQEDLKDAAEIRKVDSDAIKALTEAGYEPKSVIDAVTSGDLTRLKHTGVFSVQLQPPGSQGGGNQPPDGATDAPADDSDDDSDDGSAGRALLSAHVNGRTA